MTFEIVSTRARFAELETDWALLWERSGESIFQSHPWISAWWGAAAGRREPAGRIVLAWRDGQLVAALPLCVRRHRGLRVLEWAAKECSDYCDALVSPQDDRAATALALWEASVAAGGYDLAYLSHLEPGGVAGELVGGLGPLALHHRGDVTLRVRSSWPSGKAWFDALPKKPRQNHKRGERALEESGAARIRLVEPGEPLGPMLNRLVSLKRDWLIRTSQASTLLQQQGLFEALVGVASTAGKLRLFVVEVDGEVVAGSVNFVDRDRLMAFFAAYDPAYEKASLGMLLMVHYIRWAFDQGLSEVDFLCGAEEYKRRFANAEVTLASAVAAATLRGRAALAVDRTVDAFRTWRAGNAEPAEPRLRRSGPEVAGT